MKAPKLPSFFKQNTYKRYQGTYRYYDPHKERIDNLRKKYHLDENENSTEESSYFREEKTGQMRAQWEKSRKLQRSRSSARTLVLFVLMLVVLAIWILKSNFFEHFFETFMK